MKGILLLLSFLTLSATAGDLVSERLAKGLILQSANITINGKPAETRYYGVDGKTWLEIVSPVGELAIPGETVVNGSEPNFMVGLTHDGDEYMHSGKYESGVTLTFSESGELRVVGKLFSQNAAMKGRLEYINLDVVIPAQ